MMLEQSSTQFPQIKIRPGPSIIGPTSRSFLPQKLQILTLRLEEPEEEPLLSFDIMDYSFLLYACGCSCESNENRLLSKSLRLF
jgi:hypothetical protein